MPYLTDLAAIARKTSLEVIEVAGWETRGRGPMSDVRAVVCHHTATLNRTADMPSLNTLINGRPDLSGPLSQFGLSRSGKVYVIAAGRCNHAGAVQNPSWGNSHAVGIEAEATGTDATWPEVQLAAYAQLCRALVDYFGLSVSAVLGHKEVADPPGRKPDPNFDMPAFRARVSALGGSPAVPPVPPPPAIPPPTATPAPMSSWPSWLPSWPWFESEAPSGAGAATPVALPGAARPRQDVLSVYLSGQALNVRRHLNALRDFRRDEFGSQPARPSEGHVQAVNGLLATLRGPLVTLVNKLDRASDEAQARPTRARVGLALELKTQAHDLVRATERVWDFYFELFGQRQSAFGEWLDACDRITLDCYRHVFMHLGNERSIPAPAPFCYMRTGFSPATFRRGIPLRRLGRQLNPFPLVQLPYHRMVNPWTMGAILHEVSHNLQNELRLEQAVPSAIARQLGTAGLPAPVTAIWVRWNREIFGDMVGCLLGGEAFVASLMDVIGRSQSQSLAYSPRGVHPTPYLRTFLSCELLRRMGFGERAVELRKAWSALYPSTQGSTLPPTLLATADRAIPAVVEAVCYTPFNGLGGKSLRDVIHFEPRHQSMIEEAGRRLAKGVDPGVVPERFLIGAVRSALDQGRGDPDRLMRNFYVQWRGGNAVTLIDSRGALDRAVRDLWLAVAELVLSTNDDQPEASDLASAEHVAQLAVEIQARVAEALAGFAGGPPGSPEDAMRELDDVERLVREAGLIYWRDLRAYGPVSQLRGSTRRRGGAWPSWWSGVEQSIERCEEPLVAAGHAVGAAWHELVTQPPIEPTRSNIPRRLS